MEQQNQQSQPPVFNPQGQVQQPVPQFQPRVQAKPMMNPVEAVTTCFKKFLDFKGRARRSEYWWYFLFTLVVSWVFNIVGSFFPMLIYVGLLCGLLLTIPQLSALTRRLHDTGRSGWWVLLYALSLLAVYGSMIVIFYPLFNQLNAEGDYMMLGQIAADAIGNSPVASTIFVVGTLLSVIFWIVNLVFSILDSHWGENKYGPSPKYQ